MTPQDNPMGGPPGAMAPWNPTRQQLDQLEQILKRMMKDQQPPTPTQPPSNWSAPQNPGAHSAPRPHTPAPTGTGFSGYGSAGPAMASPGPQPGSGPWSPPQTSPGHPQGGGNPFGGFTQPYSGVPGNPGGPNWLEPANSWNPSATTWAPLAESWRQQPGTFAGPGESSAPSTALRSTQSPGVSTGLGSPNPDRFRPVPLPTAEPNNETGITWMVNQLVDLPLMAFGPPGRFFMGSAGRYLMGLLGLGMASYAGLILACDWLDWSWADQLLPWQLVGRFFSTNRS